MPEVQTQDPMGERQDTELFYMLVRMISTNALLAMGKIVPEGQQAPQPDLEAAAVFVDMLAMLEAKTSGKRNAHEDQIIKSALNQLQLAFIELAREHGMPGAEAAESQAQASEAPVAPAAPVAAPAPVPAPAPAAPQSDEAKAAAAAKEEKVKYRKSYGA